MKTIFSVVHGDFSCDFLSGLLKKRKNQPIALRESIIITIQGNASLRDVVKETLLKDHASQKKNPCCFTKPVASGHELQDALQELEGIAKDPNFNPLSLSSRFLKIVLADPFVRAELESGFEDNADDNITPLALARAAKNWITENPFLLRYVLGQLGRSHAYIKVGDTTDLSQHGKVSSLVRDIEAIRNNPQYSGNEEIQAAVLERLLKDPLVMEQIKNEPRDSDNKLNISTSVENGQQADAAVPGR